MAKVHKRKSFGYGVPAPRTLEVPRLGDYLTLPQAEALAQISMWTLRAFIKKGAMPCIRIGRRIVIERRDLEEFLHRHKTTATSGPLSHA